MGKMSQLPPHATVDGTEEIPVVRGPEGARESALMPAALFADAAVRPTPEEIQAAVAAAGVGAMTFAATRAELAALPPATHKSAVLGEGKRRGGFVFDSANHAAHVAADPLQGLFVAPPSDPSGASGAWVRLFDGPLNVQWFGAVADNATDAAPAILAAIAASKALGHAGSYSTGGPAVYIPAGLYYCASTIDWNHTLHLFGDGGGDAGGDPTTLRFPAGKTGLRLQYVDTSGNATLDGAGHTQAAGSIVSSLVLVGGYADFASTPEMDAHGLHAKVRFTARNVTANAFQGDGFHIVASVGGDGATRGNANGWNLDKCAAYSCRNGLYLEGSDVNAGMSHGFNASYCRRWGIFDRSFLGNTHVAPHAEANGIVDPAAPPTVVSHGGKRYAVKIGQEAGAAANAPSGSTADNTWWIYLYDGGPAAPQMPAWANGIAVRSGGSYGGDNLNAVSTFVGAYHEMGQGNGQIAQNMLGIGGNCTFAGPWLRAALGAVQLKGRVWFQGNLDVESGQINWGRSDQDRLEQFYALNGTSQNYYMGAGTSYVGGFQANPFYMGLQSYGEIRFRIGGQYAPVDVAKVQAGGLYLQAGKKLYVNDVQVVADRRPAIANHASDATVNAILAALRAHGLIEP